MGEIAFGRLRTGRSPEQAVATRRAVEERAEGRVRGHRRPCKQYRHAPSDASGDPVEGR